MNRIHKVYDTTTDTWVDFVGQVPQKGDRILISGITHTIIEVSWEHDAAAQNYGLVARCLTRRGK